MRLIRHFFVACIVTVFIISLFPPEGEAKVQMSSTIIELWFQDPVLLHSNALEVIDTSGKSFELSNTYVDTNDDPHNIGELKEPLPASRYTIKANVIALDGDILSVKFSFEVLNEEAKNENVPLKLNKQAPNDEQIIQEGPTNCWIQSIRMAESLMYQLPVS